MKSFIDGTINYEYLSNKAYDLWKKCDGRENGYNLSLEIYKELIMSKHLVTGVCGFVGSHLARRLLSGRASSIRS